MEIGTIIFLLLVHHLLAVLLGVTWASKKRIGTNWGMFFLLFGTIILGSIIINMSPSKNKLKDLKIGVYGYDKWIAAISVIACLFSLWTVYSLTNTFYWNLDEKIQRIFFAVNFSILSGGAAFYFYSRFERHYKIYLNIINPIELDEPARPTKVVEDLKPLEIEVFVPEKPSYEIVETEGSSRNNLIFWIIAILVISVILILFFRYTLYNTAVNIQIFVSRGNK